MELLLISIAFCYRNSRLAKSRGQNVILWSLITLIAMFILVVAVVLVYTYVYLLNNGGIYTRKGLELYFNESIIRKLTVYAIAAGGGLIMGYILERMPVVNSKK